MWTLSEDRRLLHGPVYLYSVGHQICAVRAVDAQRPSLLRAAVTGDELCFFGGPAVGVGGGLTRYRFPALDFNYRRGELYFSETAFRVQTIRRAHLVDKRNNSAVVHGVGVVKGTPPRRRRRRLTGCFEFVRPMSHVRFIARLYCAIKSQHATVQLHAATLSRKQTKPT